jgi:hypothetical protein
MAVLKRHSDLSKQIPEDVLERTRKAGVKDVDWYAGRLAGDEDANATAPPQERRELEEAAERHREGPPRDEEKAPLMTRLRALLPHARPAR